MISQHIFDIQSISREEAVAKYFQIQFKEGSHKIWNNTKFNIFLAQRGAGPSPVESCILAWVAGGWFLLYILFVFVFSLYLYLRMYLYLLATLGHRSHILMWRKCHLLGLIWSEIKQLWDVGLKEYISDMWVWITISKDRSNDKCYTHRQLKVERGGFHHKLSLRGHHWT